MAAGWGEYAVCLLSLVYNQSSAVTSVFSSHLSGKVHWRGFLKKLRGIAAGAVIAIRVRGEEVGAQHRHSGRNSASDCFHPSNPTMFGHFSVWWSYFVVSGRVCPGSGKCSVACALAGRRPGPLSVCAIGSKIVPVGLEGSHDQRGEEVQNLRTEYSAPSSLTGVGQKGPLVPVAEPRAGLVIEANSGELGHSAFRPAIRTRFSSHSNVVQCEDSFRSKTRVAASGSTPRVGLQPVTGFMTGLNAQSRQQLDRAKNTTFGSGATRRSYAGLLSGKVDSSGVGGGTTNEANGEQGGKSVDLDEVRRSS